MYARLAGVPWNMSERRSWGCCDHFTFLLASLLLSPSLPFLPTLHPVPFPSPRYILLPPLLSRSNTSPSFLNASSSARARKGELCSAVSPPLPACYTNRVAFPRSSQDVRCWRWLVLDVHAELWGKER
eukprot:767223-Hanusia_phi.AAC.3